MLRLPAESAPPCGNRRRFCRKTAQLSFYLASVYRKRRRFSPRFRQSAKKFGSFCAADAKGRAFGRFRAASVKGAQVKDRARGRQFRAESASVPGHSARKKPSAAPPIFRSTPRGRRAITQTATPPHGRQLTAQSGKAGRKQQVAGQTAELFRGVCDGARAKKSECGAAHFSVDTARAEPSSRHGPLARFQRPRPALARVGCADRRADGGQSRRRQPRRTGGS